MIDFYSWWHFYFYGVGSPWAKCCTLPTLDFRGHRWCTHCSSGSTISTSYHWYFRCKCRSTYQWFLEPHVFIFTSESSCYLRRWFLHSCFFKKKISDDILYSAMCQIRWERYFFFTSAVFFLYMLWLCYLISIWSILLSVNCFCFSRNLKDLSLRGTLGPELGTLSHLRAL